MEAKGEITECIEAVRLGKQGARDRLYWLVYDDLKRIARSIPGVSEPGGTLPPTALVHQTFIELERRFPLPPQLCQESRATFYHSVALAMRTIARDHCRARRAMRRGGGARLEPLRESRVGSIQDFDPVDYVALDRALEQLESYNVRWYRVVMLKHFAGRTLAEIADWLDVATSTVISDWSLARAYLQRELAHHESGD